MPCDPPDGKDLNLSGSFLFFATIPLVRPFYIFNTAVSQPTRGAVRTLLVATHMLAASAIYKMASIHKIPGKAKIVALPVVLALSFASHFALDAVPHHEMQMPGNVLVGLAVIGFLCRVAWRDKDPILLFAAFLGALPDAMWVLKISPTYDAIHSALHFSGVRVPFYALIIEFIGIAVLLLINYKRRITER